MSISVGNVKPGKTGSKYVINVIVVSSGLVPGLFLSDGLQIRPKLQRNI